ncbi:hypothetical protein CEXT_247821 [Caerostris extrusa]|uniref:Uncharacterized protein n=1 Tax=Caerostris extrusa TaxID=172846 RepID=A0AAV4T251_CAEEX|nr:hypothetical protein CEXT_247821 [Caerostris extrusa]
MEKGISTISSTSPPFPKPKVTQKKKSLTGHSSSIIIDRCPSLTLEASVGNRNQKKSMIVALKILSNVIPVQYFKTLPPGTNNKSSQTVERNQFNRLKAIELSPKWMTKVVVRGNFSLQTPTSSKQKVKQRTMMLVSINTTSCLKLKSLKSLFKKISSNNN